MERLTYEGQFWPPTLMVELQSAGIEVATVYGNTSRETQQIIPARSVTVIVPDEQAESEVAAVVDAHDVGSALKAEADKRKQIAQNKQAAAAKLRAFYLDTVGLTIEEIEDSNIIKE